MNTAIEPHRPETVDVVQLEAAVRWLAEAVDLVEISRFRDNAEAARVLAHQRDLGVEAENHAAELRLRAERRLGELLLPLPKQHGGRPPDNAGQHGAAPLTRAQLGIKNDVSDRSQAIARVPETEFEDHIRKARAQHKRLTSKPLIRRGRHPEPAPEPEPPVAPKLEVMAQRQQVLRLLRRARLDLLSMPAPQVLLVTHVRDHDELRALIRDLRDWLNELETTLDKPIRIAD